MIEGWSRRIASGAVALLLPAAVVAGDVGAPATFYASECAFCHGASGAGDGPASAMLTPRPTSFASAAYWKSADRKALAKVIAEGRGGTAMMPFSSRLSAPQIDALVTHLESFAK
jgi:mono/diheme cytochrome c family protein